MKAGRVSEYFVAVVGYTSNMGGITSCGLCNTQAKPEDLMHAAESAICRRCVEQGVAHTLHITAIVRDGQHLQAARETCTLCKKPTPSANLYHGNSAEGRACIACLQDAYGLLTQTTELHGRRRLMRSREERLVSSLLKDHFESAELDEIVTSSRTFPSYLRADLQVALDELLRADGVRCVGLHARYNFESLNYGTLLKDSHDPVVVAPLQYEEVDVGAPEPVKCVRVALWMGRQSELRYSALLTREHEHGRNLGWRIEFGVPAGQPGEELVRQFFRYLERKVQESASYRGKVLSLECEPDYRGMRAGNVIVHRLPAVERSAIILPEATLALLERNVFKFLLQRAALSELGLSMKKGLLFYGPPGTGKTHTIRYLAGALAEHTTLLITAAEIAALGEYMALARLLSPAIVVIEDVDLIARERTELQHPGQESLLNKLLNEMDGLRENTEVLFILTTNHPKALEAALASRPGRIDQAIEFPLPDAAGRLRLLRLYAGKLQLPDEVAETVVRRTDGVSAAFMKELMRRTAQYAVERSATNRSATLEDVDQALQEMLFDGGRLNAELLGAVWRGHARDEPEPQP